MTTRTTLLSGLGAVALAAGLGTGAQAATICFAFQDLETEFWVAGHMAITTTLTEAGHTVIERNAQEDANRQLEQVNDCIAQGVDGIIVIPQDGESAVTIVETAQENDVPSPCSTARPRTCPRHRRGRRQRRDRPAGRRLRGHEAMEQITDRPIQSLIIVGDLGDPNAVGRRDGFYEAINAYGDKFATPIEVASEWDAATALANLEAAVTANEQIDLIFTSSDFLFPTIRSVLEPRGMWAPRGEEGHVLMAGPRRRRHRLPAHQGRLRGRDRRAGPLLRGRGGHERDPRRHRGGRGAAQRGDRGPGLRADRRQHRRARDGHVGLRAPVRRLPEPVSPESPGGAAPPGPCPE
jgi:inositol transport system substrate-binding protein